MKKNTGWFKVKPPLNAKRTVLQQEFDDSYALRDLADRVREFYSLPAMKVWDMDIVHTDGVACTLSSLSSGWNVIESLKLKDVFAEALGSEIRLCMYHHATRYVFKIQGAA